ncbi:hypothetical protein WJX84_006478 [Apatococcus fuscideae]|uniref:Uncharacterized protein n=1 Tax=Apatococcus fuscideae TaxID=2026836 RepID=A0AAW1T7W1_9CHLO
MEDAWSVGGGEDYPAGVSSFGGENAPWGMGWQTSERNLVWNDELKMGLLKKIAAAELGIGAAEVEKKIATLQQLLPDIIPKMAQMKAQLLVRLAANVEQLAQRLLDLKLIFPSANVGLMVSKAPALALMENLDHIQQGADAFRRMLPDADLDMIVQEHASVLDTDTFKKALQEAQRLLPGMDVGELLSRDPGMVLQFQRGSTMIAYDPVPGQK